MLCPYCGSSKSKVVDKREAEENKVTRRRRECLKCGKRYTTYERVETPLIVVKRDGRKEKYSKEKLKAGVMKACMKRPISIKKIEKLVDDVESEIKGMGCLEVRSKIIGDLVMGKLKKLDKVAYVRFASYYKDFKDVKSFKKELEG